MKLLLFFFETAFTSFHFSPLLLSVSSASCAFKKIAKCGELFYSKPNITLSASAPLNIKMANDIFVPLFLIRHVAVVGLLLFSTGIMCIRHSQITLNRELLERVSKS